MRAPAFVPIEDILVDTSLADIPFACPVERCHGACCTVPGADEGAPLLPEEAERIAELLPKVFPRLSVEAQRLIQQQGAVLEREGKYYTRCVQRGPCVFVIWEGVVARCALEQAYEEGLISFRKPLSCHLFPLRLRSRAGRRYLVFEPFAECAPAYAYGRQCGQPVLTMVSAALERAFGAQWCEELRRVFRSQWAQ